VRQPGKLLATTFSTLACASLGALPGLAGAVPAAVAAPASSRAAGPAAHAHARSHRHARSRDRQASSGCSAVRARPRRGERALNRCQALAPKTAPSRLPKTRPSLRSHPAPVPVALAPSAGAAPTASGSGKASATIAQTLATTCQNTELTPEPGNLDLARAAVLCLINQQRAENGVNPLEANGQLEQAAEGHCSEMIADDYFAHVSPSGETPVERIQGTGYIPGPSVGYVIGENLAWGTYSLATPQAIVAAWMASPGHRANILEAQYTETGIGITPAVPASDAAGAPGATYAQEFGVIIH